MELKTTTIDDHLFDSFFECRNSRLLTKNSCCFNVLGVAFTAGSAHGGQCYSIVIIDKLYVQIPV